MIRCHDLSRRYFKRGEEIAALDEISFDLPQGNFTVLRGSSGSGKTTLLLSLGGLLQPTTGHVQVAGIDVYSLDRRARAAFRAESIGFVFQLFHLVSYLSVYQNVLLGRRLGERRQRRRRADELLERVGLTYRRTHRPTELSAGERQRVAIARALLNRPAVLLADEPTGNLDSGSAEAVLDLFAEYNVEGGTVLMATHSELNGRPADQVLRLAGGRLVGSEAE